MTEHRCPRGRALCSSASILFDNGGACGAHPEIRGTIASGPVKPPYDGLVYIPLHHADNGTPCDPVNPEGCERRSGGEDTRDTGIFGRWYKAHYADEWHKERRERRSGKERRATPMGRMLVLKEDWKSRSGRDRRQAKPESRADGPPVCGTCGEALCARPLRRVNTFMPGSKRTCGKHGIVEAALPHHAEFDDPKDGPADPPGQTGRCKREQPQPSTTELVGRLKEAAAYGPDIIHATDVGLLFDSAASRLEAQEQEIERLRDEVREWICDQCHMVYPGPPQQGFHCVHCPRCQGDTMPELAWKVLLANREVERLRAALGYDDPWPAADVMDHLSAAATHLLDNHDCDRHGWEQIRSVAQRGLLYAEKFRAAISLIPKEPSDG